MRLAAQLGLRLLGASRVVLLLLDCFCGPIDALPLAVGGGFSFSSGLASHEVRLPVRDAFALCGANPNVRVVFLLLV